MVTREENFRIVYVCFMVWKWFMVWRVLLVVDARGRLEEHEKSLRVAGGDNREQL